MAKTGQIRPSPTQSAASHRRATGMGYARGEETKLRIIHAAVELFGAQGYEQTSTRDIAARAGVNSPALQYYFDGKDGLYLACAEHMAARGHALMAPAMDKARIILAGKPDTDTLIDGFWSIVECAADAMLLGREVDAWMRFMSWEDLRLAGKHNDATVVLDKCFRREVNLLLRTLVGRIIGRKPDHAQTRIRTLTLMGQILVFFKMREKALEDLGWTELNASRLKILKIVIRSQIVAALRAAAKPKRRTI